MASGTYLNELWKLWMQEYLSNLREKSQVLLKGSHSTASTETKVGDIVLIKENLPRGRWKIGKICELIQSQDKLI